MSASQVLSRKLSLGQARKLEEDSFNIVPQIFESLAAFDRTVLMEVSCPSDSLLSATIQSLAGSASAATRCAAWNKCDLGSAEGVQLIMQQLQLLKPRHVWLSPDCKAFSPAQNANQGSEAQREELKQQRQREIKTFLGAAAVCHACLQLGIHVSWSWPEHSNAWRLPFMQRLIQRCQLQVAICKGCRVNARHSVTQRLLQKGWKVATTCKRLAEVLHLPCRCARDYVHGRCEGSEGARTQGYPPEFVRKVAQVMLQEMNHQQVQWECQGKTGLPEGFGEGMFCQCQETHVSGHHVSCGACCLQGSGLLRQVAGAPAQAGPQVSQEGEASGSFQGRGSGQVMPEYEGLSLEEFEAFMSKGEVRTCEEAAEGLLKSKDFKHQSCESLLEQLPLKPVLKHRRMLGDARSVYLILGAYAFGNHYGVTRKTQQFPHLCRYLNAYMENWNGPFCRTSVCISLNNQVPLHKDNNNDNQYDNVLIGLGSFQKGGLWIQDSEGSSEGSSSKRQLPNGSWINGKICDIRHKVTRFSPKLWHGSQEWIGNRITVTAFVSRGVYHLSSEEYRSLNHHGFNSPPRKQPMSHTHSEKQQESMAAETSSSSREPKPRTPKQEEEHILRQLHLLHAATGHGSVRTMIDTLKRRGASPKVLEIAGKFKCSACQERGQPPPRNLSSLDVLPPKWKTVSMDVGHWTHPRSGEQVQFVVVIDEGSRFRIARILTTGSKQQPNAAQCLDYLQEGWTQVFGKPEVLRLDPAGAFRSRAVEAYCDRRSIFLDLVPADAHWQIGVCEQAIKGIKHVMDRLIAEDDQLSSKEALSLSVETFNNREQIRGYTPVQHAFGRNPDVTGRFVVHPEHLGDDWRLESADEEFIRSAQARASAEKALSDWQAQQRITRAMNSKGRPAYDYVPGELVFFWRTQESGQGRRQPGTSRGRFLGPARILATETRKEPDGSLRPGSAIWLVRGRSLLKCCPEQLRRASSRETLLESLAQKDHREDSTPWTFHRVVEEVGGNRYEDITAETPSHQEWNRAQDVREELPPTRFRIRGKRLGPEPVENEEMISEEAPTPSAPSRPVRPRTRGPTTSGETSQAWWSDLEAEHFGGGSSFWADEACAVEVSIDLPDSVRGKEKAIDNLYSFFAGALKRQAVEVSERRLSEADRQGFKEAKSVEVKNFLAARAFEALPPEYRPDRSQAVGMRWVLTWKLKDDGSRKPKARAVLLGYQDPSYEHRSTTAPVMTRQTRQLLLQVAANRRWSVYKGDVSGAFLQGRDYPDHLLCAPCDEICEAMSLPRGSIVRLRKACYGLVDAPLEWYRTVSAFLEEQGFQRLWSDACAWTLREGSQLLGVVSGHVDDFLFSGEETHPKWKSAIQAIQARFKWGDWDKDNFVQCGVQISREGADFKLSQKRYVEEIKEIPVNALRKKDLKAPTSEREKTQLRALLGALSWNAQQVSPHTSADVSLLLSEIPKSTVETILRANNLLFRTKARSSHEMIIHGFPDERDLGLYAWVDAASQNRDDGGSTQGIVVGMGEKGMLQGQVSKISVISWHSNKIDRTCRSPGASETIAAVNGEDILYFIRYQWAELLYGGVDTRNPDETVRKVQGTVITDSRNVFDKLCTEVLVVKGAEKKANLELLSLKESQQRTSVNVRWVHSEAQLANSLTKWNGGHELELFYKMQSCWRIVEDPEMMSARRRRAQGLQPLQQQQQQQDSNVAHHSHRMSENQNEVNDEELFSL